jgi:hypothetical protein
MKKISLLTFYFTSCTLLSYGQVYRWDTKILIDTAGHRVYKQKATSETISNLANPSSTPRPQADELKKGKRANAEKRKVTITAYITATGIEDDGDYHLVLQALNGKATLIGEIPDPATPKLKGFPTLKNNYSIARHTVDKEIGIPPQKVTLLTKKVKVKITGTVFFDKMAHGNGHAPNGIEIHPILSLQLLP